MRSPKRDEADIADGDNLTSYICTLMRGNWIGFEDQLSLSFAASAKPSAPPCSVIPSLTDFEYHEVLGVDILCYSRPQALTRISTSPDFG